MFKKATLLLVNLNIKNNQFVYFKLIFFAICQHNLCLTSVKKNIKLKLTNESLE